MGGFADAEPGFQSVFRTEFGDTRPLRLAYTAARIEAADVAAPRWPGDDQKLAQISDLLRRLHSQALATEFAQLHPDQRMTWSGMPDLGGVGDTLLEPQGMHHAIFLPPLEEFEFRSTVPVVGRLLVWFRRAWYGVAVKWALRHFLSQQQAINQITREHLQRLEHTLADFRSRQDVVLRFAGDQMNEIRNYLSGRERQAAEVDRFLLENIVQAEEEAIFALLWPLRWDLVLDATIPQEETT